LSYGEIKKVRGGPAIYSLEGSRFIQLSYGDH